MTIDITVPGGAPQDIECSPGGLAGHDFCTFVSPVGDNYVPGHLTDIFSVTAIARDGTISSPPVTDTDPLDPSAPI